MTTEESHIVELSQKIVEIELRRDADSLADMICDDYIGVDPSGTLINKAISVDRYRNPDFELSEHGITDIHVAVLGDVAIEVGVMRLAGRLGSFQFGGSYRYTHTWLKTEDGWKVRGSQLTPVLRRGSMYLTNTH